MISIVHAKVATLPDEPGVEINRGEWNDEHDISGFGTAAESDASDFATAAQGALADSAVQPGDLGTAASHAATDFATAAQGAEADTAVQPGDLGSAAYHPATDFATAAQGVKADSAVQPTRRVDTTAPLAGGGDLSADRTITLNIGNGLYVDAGVLKNAFPYDPLVVEVFT